MSGVEEPLGLLAPLLFASTTANRMAPISSHLLIVPAHNEEGVDPGPGDLAPLPSRKPLLHHLSTGCNVMRALVLFETPLFR